VPLAASPMLGARVTTLLPVRSGIWEGVAGFGRTGRTLEVYGDQLCTPPGSGLNAVRSARVGDEILVLGVQYPAGTSQERFPAAVLLRRD